MGHKNYALIELYDAYSGKLCREKVPSLAEILEKNQNTNFTNKPFGAQPLDARHEELNKKGQNMFKGEKVEDFRLALTILDDVHAMRSNMFEFSNLTDRSNNKNRKDCVPNYEPLIAKMRIGIRESGYFSEAHVERDLESMVGEPLNEALTDIFKISIAQRDSDILNVVRHSDLNCGYSQGSKLAVLEKDMNPKESE